MFDHRRQVWAGLAVGALLTFTGAACSSKVATGALGNDSVKSIKVQASLGGGATPLDAVPAPDGSFSYFTVQGGQIFRTTGDPKAPVAVDTSNALEHATGIAVGTDGSKLYVADSAAVMSLPSKGGTPAPVPGTEGTSPRGVEVASQNGSDVLYFSGKDPAGGAPAVFKVPAAGGPRTVVAKGTPLVAPDGIAVSGSGKVFVGDHGTSTGAVYRLDSGGPTKLASVDRLGNPGGIGLTRDDSTLLVSSLSKSGTAQVILIDLKTLNSGVVDKVIGQNTGAGGLHRAYDASSFAWADVSRSGRIYRVEP